MKCPTCGFNNQPGAKFCSGHCGGSSLISPGSDKLRQKEDKKPTKQESAALELEAYMESLAKKPTKQESAALAKSIVEGVRNPKPTPEFQKLELEAAMKRLRKNPANYPFGQPELEGAKTPNDYKNLRLLSAVFEGITFGITGFMSGIAMLQGIPAWTVGLLGLGIGIVYGASNPRLPNTPSKVSSMVFMWLALCTVIWLIRLVF